jgi:hypothetical protein
MCYRTKEINNLTNHKEFAEEIFIFNQIARDCDANKKLEEETNRIIDCFLL